MGLRRVGARVHVAVVDESGKPAAGAPVRLELFSNKTFSYRKRLVGGFYAYENTIETRKAGQLCSGKTDQRGDFVCNAKTGADRLGPGPGLGHR